MRGGTQCSPEGRAESLVDPDTAEVSTKLRLSNVGVFSYRVLPYVKEAIHWPVPHKPKVDFKFQCPDKWCQAIARGMLFDMGYDPRYTSYQIEIYDLTSNSWMPYTPALRMFMRQQEKKKSTLVVS